MAASQERSLPQSFHFPAVRGVRKSVEFFKIVPRPLICVKSQLVSVTLVLDMDSFQAYPDLGFLT